MRDLVGPGLEEHTGDGSHGPCEWRRSARESLDEHIHGNTNDFYNARSIVNGDTATNGQAIATAARRYQGALGGWASVFVVDNHQPPNS